MTGRPVRPVGALKRFPTRDNIEETTPLKRVRRILRGMAIAAGGCIAVVILLFGIITIWPAAGARGADLLRQVLGDKAVAGLEMRYFELQDNLKKWKYQLGLEKSAAPWATDPAAPPMLEPTLTPVPTALPPLGPTRPTPLQPKITETPFPTTTVTHTLPAPAWQPPIITPPGNADGEGIWSAYILDAQGQAVAYRTFLQPDPERPYTIVAVVAIDLNRTRLHFVLGTKEPAGQGMLQRSGVIPPEDRAANVLLAAFNGGFQARHGQFGAMAGGILAMPPREGLGTLVISRNGNVSLGEWEAGMTIHPNIEAFRQNGPLVLQAGQINPRIHNNSPQDWGYTVTDVSPTIRTGIGLSADNGTLYYFCGPSLSMQALAVSMQAAGAWNAIQLDINNYWSLFVKFQFRGEEILSKALLPRLMVADTDRYLWNSPRDFFYITGTAQQTIP
jgi:hypothetical protein